MIENQPRAANSIHGSVVSNARLKRRHAAETRLKAYGILALTLAGLALVALLWSVFGKASLALSEHYVTLPVSVETGDSALLAKADFEAITKDSIAARFPEASSREDRKQRAELVSGGAVFALRDAVLAQPTLALAPFEHAFLASDTVDLYLKGESGALADQAKAGDLTVTVDAGEVEFVSSQSDFTAILALVRTDLVDQAKKLRDKAQLQDNGVVEYTRRAETETGEKKTKDSDEAAKRAGKRDALLAEALDLEQRAASPEGREKLTDEMPSLLIKLGETWIKVGEIGSAAGKGEIVGAIPHQSAYSGKDWQFMVNPTPEASRKITDKQTIWIETLRQSGDIESKFNWRFFTAGDSREPELAGIWGAAVGSFWTMLVTLLLAFPTGVLAAIYLEEFAPKNRMTDFIEVNINNLAAVPSIVFGLLGLAFCLGFLGIPRSAPLAGGIVLALMTLPTIIITSRTSVRAVPPSIRDAALGVGASKLQTSFHHVLPLAMPGILTGVIIGMARALGETAPLIMIGMVAFIVDIPRGITDSATVLPVQIYRWSDFPERAFEARTAAAICVLLVFLIAMNAVAVFLRNRFERRW